jgi:hypothetical protein
MHILLLARRFCLSVKDRVVKRREIVNHIRDEELMIKGRNYNLKKENITYKKRRIQIERKKKGVGFGV